MNRIADRRGRKLIIILLRPALYLWLIILVLAPSPSWLLVAWLFRGIAMSSSAYDTLGMELVPSGQRGRWLGIINTYSSALRIPAPVIGSLLYTGPNPSMIFILPLAMDLFIRMPLLALRVPETIKK